MLFIDGIVFSLQRSGGISVYYNEFINRYMASGERLELLIYKNTNEYSGRWLCNRKSRISTMLERFLDVKIKNSDEKDIFHSTYYRLPNRNFNGCVITTVHDFTDEIYGQGLNKKILSWQKKKAILGSDGIICISENTKLDLLKFIPEVAGKPIKVIYNGVGDFKRIPCEQDQKEFKKVVFIGARKGYKNFLAAIEGVSKYNNAILVIVGGGDLNAEELFVLNKMLPGRFNFLGFQPDAVLNQIYSSSYALLYPSLYEGFGIPVIEAMKSGCPVIAANYSSIPEISGGSAILLDDITGDSICSSLTRLEDDCYRKKIIEEGISHASIYSWDKMYSETVSFYKEVLEIR